MSLPLRIVSQDALTVTVGWNPVAGAAGYRLSRAGFQLRSHTWDAQRSSARFLKSHWYKVEPLMAPEVGVLAFPGNNVYPGELK